MEYVRVKDLGKIVTGNTPPTSKPEYYGDFIPFIKATDIPLNSKYTFTTEQSYSKEVYKKYKESLIPQGSTCVVTIGSIGKKLTYAHTDLFVNQAINAIIEELLEKAEPEEVKEKSDVPFMKTLAIRQPWASLIACGVKDIECRDSMPTKCRKIFVAASGTKVPWSELDNTVKNVLANLEKAGKLRSYDKLPTKCIIGYVDIVNVTFDPVESVWGRDWDGIKYVLENAHELDEYIYGKNKATPYFYNTEGYDENNLPAAHKVDLTGIDLPK